MKKLALAAFLVVTVVGISVFSTYVVMRDEIASRRHSVDQAWNHVNSALQRRADLVPAVVASMKGVAARHRDIAADIDRALADLQSASTPVGAVVANRRLDAAVSRLFALQGDDPDLLMNQKFFAMQDQWAAASNRIAPERVRYDQAVQDYNAFISDFPNDVFAHWASFPPMVNYFIAEASASPRTMGGVDAPVRGL
jgi:LemA protein